MPPAPFEKAIHKVELRAAEHPGCIQIETPDPWFDHFVNHWLPRQIEYLGRANRLTTDPQSRNFLQDAMGTVFVNPAACPRDHPHVPQPAAGRRPDARRRSAPARRRVEVHQHGPARRPLFVAADCRRAYVYGTGDSDFLRETVPFADAAAGATVYEHVRLGLGWLLQDRSPRGLSRIWQGDWNDPMNMVGPKGIGESAMLSEALSYGLRLVGRVGRIGGPRVGRPAVGR